MAAFGYEALAPSGKILKGSVNADNLELARQELKRQGLNVLKINEQSALTKDISLKFGGAPKPRDMSVFCRQFVGMSKAGVTLVDPESTWIGAEVTIGRDTIIRPCTMLMGNTAVGGDCVVGPNVHLMDALVEDGAEILNVTIM